MSEYLPSIPPLPQVPSVPMILVKKDPLAALAENVRDSEKAATLFERALNAASSLKSEELATGRYVAGCELEKQRSRDWAEVEKGRAQAWEAVRLADLAVKHAIETRKCEVVQNIVIAAIQSGLISGPISGLKLKHRKINLSFYDSEVFTLKFF